MFFKRDTWTHEFFCLADKEQMAVSSRSFKIQLQQAGLGRKKIWFNSKANATEVKTKLEESYPKLRGDLCKSGLGHFASEKSFPSNFAQ